MGSFRKSKSRHEKPVVQPAGHAKLQRSKEFGFLLRELSYQCKYVPKLARIHNSLLKNPVFHSKTKIPEITGTLALDEKIMGNTISMQKLIDEINFLRLNARTSLAQHPTKVKEMHKALDHAAEKERQFNELKKQNLAILIEFFARQKKH